MIGLDTNVIVRYLVQDDAAQSAAASAIIDELTEAAPGYLSLVTCVETYWVLRRAYQVEPSHCHDILEGLLNAKELRIDRSPVVRTAIQKGREGADFADAVIAELGQLAGCEHTVTFDRHAAQLPGMRRAEEDRTE